MKIRMGFVTNSSSTNFLIISEKELTKEYLFEKLGFVKGGVLEKQGNQLCDSIMEAVNLGLSGHTYTIPTYETIKEIFGDKSAMRFKEKRNHNAYWGHTNSDDSPMVQFFTSDSFEIEEQDFYLNGMACMW